MIWYKDNIDSDPYIELWRRKEWLYPFENPGREVFPLIITVEPTNHCQNDCLYCCRQMMTRKKGFMSLELMEKTAQVAGENKSAIRHGGFGEPLLHKQITEFIALSNKYNVLTTIFTNGTYLTEEMMHLFIDHELDEIRFSSTGISPTEHNQIRQPSDFYKDFESKLKMAYRVKQERDSQKPFLTVYTHVATYDDENFKNNVLKYKDKHLQYADKVDIDLTMYSRVKHIDRVKNVEEKTIIKEEYEPCVILYLKNIVHWNGDVFACDIPFNHEESHALGNLMDEHFDLKRENNSFKVQKLRADLCNDLKHKQYGICKDCYSNTTKWDDKSFWEDV